MKVVKAVLTGLFAIILVIVLNTKFGDIPPLARFLDPFQGFWTNAEGKKQNPEKELNIDGLKGSVEIRFDDQMIPHIFAENNHDLYFAQGYITAKDRLWQMDFQTRFASGRLSEVVGPKAIELDRYQRRMGMTFGAENMVKAMMDDQAITEHRNRALSPSNPFIRGTAQNPDVFFQNREAANPYYEKVPGIVQIGRAHV